MPDQDPIRPEASLAADSISTLAPPTDPAPVPDSLWTQSPPSYPENRPGDEPTGERSDASIPTRSPGDTYATARPDEPPATGLEVGPSAPIPAFTLLENLGEGGMGVVYKARQFGRNHSVALKMGLGGHYAGPN